MSRPDYIKCIENERLMANPQTHITWCGREPGIFEWTFLDLTHAANTGLSGSYSMACRACLMAADKALWTGYEKVGGKRTG